MISIEAKLKQLANPKFAENYQRFFKTGKGEYGEGDRFLGIRVPKLREIAKNHHDLPLEQVKPLLKSPFHEIRLCGFILLVNRYQKANNSKEKKSLYRVYTSHFHYLNNWDLIDVTCHKIIGPHLEHTSKKPLYQWAKSKNLWKRRISIVTTFWYIRNNDLDDSYRLAKLLLEDDHDLIHKAVGWVLRECGKKDFKRLEKFILEHYRKMPRTTLRYAIERFPEGKRKKLLNLK